MVFLYYQLPYVLADEGHPFHWINGQLYPIVGSYTEATPTQPVWYFHIGM